MTDKNNAPAPQRSRRWLKASLGAVATGVMLASGGAWADDSLPAPICNPDKLYDILSSSFHQTAAQLADDRGWAGWGQEMGGTRNVAPPESIMGSTSVGEGGIGTDAAFKDVKPLLVTTASGTTSAHQTIALGNDGNFYAWGSQEQVLAGSFTPTSGKAVQKTTLRLPTGVDAGDVDMLFASWRFLAIVANGHVYTLVHGSNTSDLHGDGGSTDTNNGWHQVKTDGAGNPVLEQVIAVRGQVGGGNQVGAVMALTQDGQVYTWGNNIYDGDGGGRPSNDGARLSSSLATQMTLPTAALDASSKVKQIGVTGGNNSAGNSNTSDGNQNNSYYVLFENGELWSLGANTHKQLGDATTIWRMTWVQVQKPANPDGAGSWSPFQDVEMFSVQEHDRGYAGSGSVGAIDSIGDVYTWGSNNGNMIGANGGATTDPKVQGNLLSQKGSGNIKARYIEVGGHTTAYSPKNSPKFCYVGHLTAGSMGNTLTGPEASGNPWEFNCDLTPAVNICGAESIGADDDELTAIPVPDVLTKLTGNAYSNDHYRGDPADKNIGDKNNPATSDGIFGKVLTPAQSINWGPVPYLDVATGEVYAPAGTPPGDYTIKYEICDVDFPDQICAAADITVTILGIKAIPDTDSTTPGTPVATPVTSNDTSPSGEPINHNSVTVVTQPPNGTVVCKGDAAGSSLQAGECQYTPKPGFKGTDTYTYQVCNSKTPTPECDTTTVTVAVGEPPAIAAYDDTAITTKGTPVTTPVVANDVAVGGELDSNSVAKVGSVIGGPSGATTSLDCSAGYCTFQADQPGTYEYSYKVCLVDPATTCDEAKVTVTVADTTGGGGTTPTPTIVASPDYDTTPVNTSVTTVVIGNDNAVGGTVNPGSVAKATDPANGSVICSAGKCTYTPTNDFVGTDTYQYKVCLVDPAATCSTTTVTIKVGDPSISAIDDTAIPSVPLDVTSNDKSTPAGAIDKSTVMVVTQPQRGLVACDGNGMCTYTSTDPNDLDEDFYHYKVCLQDMPDVCSTAKVTVPTREPVPAIKLDKEVTSSGPYAEGDTITYQFSITNIGNVPLSNTQVDDPMLGDTLSCPTASLNPGDSSICGEREYVVTAADVVEGKVYNHAIASGTGPDGKQAKGEDDVTTLLPYTPALDVAKVVTSSGPYAVGDTITYVFTATNTGNVPLENVSVNDDMLGGAVACNETTLLPGTSTTCGPVDYVLQSDDINNGQIVNVANATGTPTVEDPGNPGTPPEVTTPPAKVETPVAPAPALSILKEVVSTGPYEQDDTITYLFTVTNTGNVNMSDVFVTDALISSEPVLCANTVLTPAQSTTCGPVNYTVTAADVTAGNVHNEATTTGTPPDPNNPSTPGTPVTTPPSKVDTPTGKRPALVLEKRVISSGPYAEGDEISYQFKVTNVGNVKLNSVAVNDPLLDAEVDCAPQVLNPSEAAYCGPKAYTVTANDVIEGEVYNHATATGFTPDDEPVNAEDAVTTPLDYQPDLTLTKVVTSSGPYQVGDTITYSFTATNSGNVTLDGVSVNDPMLGGPVSCAVSTLVPSQSTLCGPVHYTLQPEDIDNGQILNVATATGTPVVEDPDNPGTLPEVTTPPAKVETSVTPVPALSIVKEVISAGPYELGDTITYLFTVTNTGNVALSGVSVDDPLVGGGIACTAGSLAPAQSTTCGPVNYAVTADDVTAGNVLNEATATGTSPADPGDPTVPGTPVTTPPATVDTEIGKKPALMLDKRVISEGPYELGDTVTYQFKVTNTGNVQLSGVAVNDPKLDAAPIACSPAALNPGESSFCGPRDYEVTADDVKLREVLNKATAQATPAGSSVSVESPEAEVTTPIKLPPPVAVPVDNPFALILLALGLLGLGARYARKRSAA